MNRYIAKLVFYIHIENGQGLSQFDEQTRILEASSAEEAFFKAKALGRKEEEIFMDARERKVSWKFVDVTELHPLEELRDGDAIYSSTYETENAPFYIETVRQKSMAIQTNLLTFV